MTTPVVPDDDARVRAALAAFADEAVRGFAPGRLVSRAATSGRRRVLLRRAAAAGAALAVAAAVTVVSTVPSLWPGRPSGRAPAVAGGQAGDLLAWPTLPAASRHRAAKESAIARSWGVEVAHELVDLQVDSGYYFLAAGRFPDGRVAVAWLTQDGAAPPRVVAQQVLARDVRVRQVSVLLDGTVAQALSIVLASWEQPPTQPSGRPTSIYVPPLTSPVTLLAVPAPESSIVGLAAGDAGGLPSPPVVVGGGLALFDGPATADRSVLVRVPGRREPVADRLTLDARTGDPGPPPSVPTPSLPSPRTAVLPDSAYQVVLRGTARDGTAWALQAARSGSDLCTRLQLASSSSNGGCTRLPGPPRGFVTAGIGGTTASGAVTGDVVRVEVQTRDGVTHEAQPLAGPGELAQLRFFAYVGAPGGPEVDVLRAYGRDGAVLGTVP